MLFILFTTSGGGKFIKNLHHGRVAFSRCMHMPDRDIQNDKFVDKPCDIEYSFVLVDSHKVIVFGVFVPKFDYEPLVTGDRLKHVVETQVARYYNLTFYIKHQLKEALIPADCQSQIKLTTLNVRGLNGLKKSVVKFDVDGGQTFLQTFQVDFQRCQIVHFGCKVTKIQINSKGIVSLFYAPIQHFSIFGDGRQSAILYLIIYRGHGSGKVAHDETAIVNPQPKGEHDGD